VIENGVYRIVFTNRGGRVKSWILKKYTDDKALRSNSSTPRPPSSMDIR